MLLILMWTAEWPSGCNNCRDPDRENLGLNAYECHVHLVAGF